MPKARSATVEYHYVRRSMPQRERRAAIRKGYEDFTFQGPKAEPPYPDDDPRRWLWQNGYDQADRVRLGRSLVGVEGAAEWN